MPVRTFALAMHRGLIVWTSYYKLHSLTSYYQLRGTSLCVWYTLCTVVESAPALERFLLEPCFPVFRAIPHRPGGQTVWSANVAECSNGEAVCRNHLDPVAATNDCSAFSSSISAISIICFLCVWFRALSGWLRFAFFNFLPWWHLAAKGSRWHLANSK